MCLLRGSTALLLGGAAVTPALSDEHYATQRLNQQQLEYRVVPRPNPHRHFVWVQRWVWDDFWGDYHLQWVPRYSSTRNVAYVRAHRTRTDAISDGSGNTTPQKSASAINDTEKQKKEIETASLDTSNPPAPIAKKPAPTITPDLSKPLTPAEIRAAIPLGKVENPKQTLASTPIKSVWGDTLGKVRDIDMSGNSIKTVDAIVVGKGAVKINAGQLKYVKSRGLLITTLSKSDAEKLPHADRS